MADENKYIKEFDKKFIDGVRSPIDGRLVELERIKVFILKALKSQKKEIIKEEKLKYMKIIEKWIKTSNPAYAEELFNLIKEDEK